MVRVEKAKPAGGSQFRRGVGASHRWLLPAAGGQPRCRATRPRPGYVSECGRGPRAWAVAALQPRWPWRYRSRRPRRNPTLSLPANQGRSSGDVKITIPNIRIDVKRFLDSARKRHTGRCFRRQEAGEDPAASCLHRTQGGQGAHREVESEGLASTPRAVAEARARANRSAMSARRDEAIRHRPRGREMRDQGVSGSQVRLPGRDRQVTTTPRSSPSLTGQDESLACPTFPVLKKWS